METKGMGDFMENLNSDEQYDLIRELLEPEFGPLYVTPPDIDETVKELSFTISEGIHMTFLGQEVS
jgi:spore protease